MIEHVVRDVDGDPSRVVVAVVCPWCGLPQEITCGREGLEAFTKGGVPIQHALPELSDNEREALVTGIEAGCWEAMFGTDDYDPDAPSCDPDF